MIEFTLGHHCLVANSRGDFVTVVESVWPIFAF